MDNYESVIIVNPKVTEEEMKELLEYIKKILTDNQANIISIEELGKKKLAYEIKKNKEGYYIQFNFEADPKVIDELERIYRIKDDIIKFMTIRNDEKNG